MSISIETESLHAFSDWKLRRTDEGYLMFNLRNGKIQITKKGPKVSWNEFCDELPKNEACWVTIPYKYENSEGLKRSKLLLIQWIPAGADKRDKMAYAMWSNSIKNGLNGIQLALQANSLEDLSEEAVMSKLD
jgi:hypothetical protein